MHAIFSVFMLVSTKWRMETGHTYFPRWMVRLSTDAEWKQVQFDAWRKSDRKRDLFWFLQLSRCFLFSSLNSQTVWWKIVTKIVFFFCFDRRSKGDVTCFIYPAPLSLSSAEMRWWRRVKWKTSDFPLAEDVKVFRRACLESVDYSWSFRDSFKAISPRLYSSLSFGLSLCTMTILK